MLWLVAEDEADIRVLVTTMFQLWGHTSMAFESGQKAWDWLDQVVAGAFTGDLPQLVLMDIRMPGKKGNEVARRMRTIARLDQTPIALMTAFALSDAERQEMIEQDGVDAIISKPLPEFDTLRQMLHGLIETRKKPVMQAAGLTAAS